MREEVRRAAARIRADLCTPYEDIAGALAVNRKTAEAYFVSDRQTLRLHHLVEMGRSPNTAELARRILLGALASLDDQHLRASDLLRLADSPMPHDRTTAIRVLLPIAAKLGLLPVNATNTAEVKA